FSVKKISLLVARRWTRRSSLLLTGTSLFVIIEDRQDLLLRPGLEKAVPDPGGAGKTLNVPGQVLAHLPHSPVLSEVGDLLPQVEPGQVQAFPAGGFRLEGLAAQGRHGQPDQPENTQDAPAEYIHVAAGLLLRPQYAFGRKNNAVTNGRNRDRFLNPFDHFPIGPTPVQILPVTRVD